MLYYSMLIGQILLGLKIGLFIFVVFIWRPEALKKYSFGQKVKMGSIPFEKGRNVILPEDWSTLKWYRWIWLTILMLILLKVIISTTVWGIGTFNPQLL